MIDNQNYARWAIEEALREYSPDSAFQVTGGIMEGQRIIVGSSERRLPKNITEAIRADAQLDIDAEVRNPVLE